MRREENHFLENINISTEKMEASSATFSNRNKYFLFKEK